MTQPERVMSAEEFTRIYRAEYVAVANFLRFSGADVQEIPDVVQSAFMALWSETKQVAHPRAWLRTVAERTLLRSNAEVVRQAHLPLPRMPLEPEPILRLLQREQAVELVAMVQRLPAAQRRVFAWRMDGFEFSEIAAHFGQPESTVRSNYRHALAKLKEFQEVKEIQTRYRIPPVQAKKPSAKGDVDDERSRVG